LFLLKYKPARPWKLLLLRIIQQFLWFIVKYRF